MASDLFGSLTTIGTTALSTYASVSDIKARSKATLTAIDAEASSFQIQQEILNDQDNDLDRELGDVMSQNALKALKAESRMRAGAAETGTAGGTTATAVKEAYMVQTLDNAVLIARKRASETDLARRSLMLRVGFDNRLQELEGGMISGGQAAVSTLSAAAGGFTSGLNLTSDKFRYEAFGRDYESAGITKNITNNDNGWLF